MRGHANLLSMWFTVENIGDCPGAAALMAAVMVEFYGRYPRDEFIIIDQDADDVDHSVVVETVPGSEEVELWKWDSLNEGYGGIYECSYPHGQGLRLDYGGSPMNSAFSIYVAPLKISADGWTEATPVRKPRRER